MPIIRTPDNDTHLTRAFALHADRATDFRAALACFPEVVGGGDFPKDRAAYALRGPESNGVILGHLAAPRQMPEAYEAIQHAIGGTFLSWGQAAFQVPPGHASFRFAAPNDYRVFEEVFSLARHQPTISGVGAAAFAALDFGFGVRGRYRDLPFGWATQDGKEAECIMTGALIVHVPAGATGTTGACFQHLARLLASATDPDELHATPVRDLPCVDGQHRIHALRIH